MKLQQLSITHFDERFTFKLQAEKAIINYRAEVRNPIDARRYERRLTDH